MVSICFLQQINGIISQVWAYLDSAVAQRVINQDVNGIFTRDALTPAELGYRGGVYQFKW